MTMKNVRLYTKAGSLETGDATLTGILMALVAGFFGVLEETVRRKNASNAVDNLKNMETRNDIA